MPLTTRHRQGTTIAVSVVLHAAVTALASWFAFGGISPPPSDRLDAFPPGAPSAAVWAINLPSMGEGFLVEDDRPVEPRADPNVDRSGDVVAHPDTGTAGHGGERAAQAPAVNLADDAERMRLSPDLLSRLDRDQLQRLRVARSRASFEDRRSTTHPAELTLVATGPGSLRERRPAAPTEPDRGGLRSPPPSVLGASVASAQSAAVNEGAPSPKGGDRAGSTWAAPGAGVLVTRVGPNHHVSAPVGDARPAVTRGPIAVAATERALPKDSVDTDQEVATMVRSLVHASTAGGIRDEGEGGSEGDGRAGAGALRGVGFIAQPMGRGPGDVYDYWTRDPRLVSYFRRIHSRIDPLWADAFPRSALFELKQGTVILEFTVTADGRVSVSWPPLRPSGVDAFDRNCAEAIRRAAPFPPIPLSLGTNLLRIRAPFVASNPVVK